MSSKIIDMHFDDSDTPKPLGRLEHYYSMAVLRVELCENCREDNPGVVEVKNLCPACRLAVEARW